MSATIALPARPTGWFATRFAALVEDAMTARYGAPPPSGDEAVEPMDAEEARLYVAMACAVHF